MHYLSFCYTQGGCRRILSVFQGYIRSYKAEKPGENVYGFQLTGALAVAGEKLSELYNTGHILFRL